MNAAGLKVVTPTPVVVRTADASDPAVDRYVAAHRHASSYHRGAWLGIIGRAFGHRTTCLVADVHGEVTGVLPLVFFASPVFGRFAVSVPFVNYGGVLADDAHSERALLDRAIDDTQRAGGSHLELRHSSQHFAELRPKRHKVAMELQLESDIDAQWAVLDKKIRNQVRKAEKSGLESRSGGGEWLPHFYDVFARNMRDLGTPVYGIRFFREVLATFPDEARIFVVMLHGRPVAASLVHWYGHRIEVPWASSLREFNPLCANVLLYWEMVKFAVASGFTTFDFGRSTPGEGTYQFKKQWGAEARELVWEYWTRPGQALPEMNPKNPRFQSAIRVWQHLPLPVTRLIGPAIVRNIP
jgi:FemAB-related protein (PEP-CTERM system-associated)